MIDVEQLTNDIGPESDTSVKPPPIARPLSAFVRHTNDDPDELLLFRFLCRFGTLLFCAPTGTGKSTLALQFAILWALALDCFGIKPARPLKSLIIQAENDDGDIAEQRDGVFAGLGLSDAERQQAESNIVIASESERAGFPFFESVVRPLLQEHKPDILWIDPALAFIGGDVKAQDCVGPFLRNGLNPLLREFNCAAVIVHHTNKPATGREKSNWTAGDLAYLGAGSAEFANHARAVIALRSIGSHDVFELHAAKRGARLRWRDKDGVTPSYVRYIAHSKEPGVIYWREADKGEADSVGGRPKSYAGQEIFELLPPEGLTRKEWLVKAKEECGASESTVDRERRDLAKAGRIAKSPVSGKWQPVRKRGATQ